MDNQHKKITGYRDLSEKEIDLMNRIKAHATATETLLLEVDELRNQKGISELGHSGREESFRCLRLAKTNLQQGFMWFVRAVALPSSF